MFGFLSRRILIVIPTLLGVTLVAFALIRLVPGDPALLLLGERGGSPEVYAAIRAKFGLDQSLPMQYWIFLKNAVAGDLGKSTHSGRAVLEEFVSRFPATLELGLVALFGAVLIGLPVGILAAVRRGTFLDYSFMSAALVGYSMPIFWWGLILILFFSVQLGWTPVSGRIDIAYDIPAWSGFLLIDSWKSGEGWPAFVSALKHLALPAIALGTIPLAAVARMTRSSMLEVLGEDYMRTARAKGVSRLGVIVVHGLRNALVPVITVIGLLAGQIVTGAVLTETIFSWPGIGRWLVASVTSRDYPVVQGGVLLIATSVILINVVVDLAYAWANPKMRVQ